MRWLYLDSYDDLKAAIALYERRGLVRCARFYDNPQATVFLCKELAYGEPGFVGGGAGYGPVRLFRASRRIACRLLRFRTTMTALSLLLFFECNHIPAWRRRES